MLQSPRARLVAVLVLVVSLVVLLACSSGADTGSGSGAVATSGATPTAVAHQHFKVGQVVSVSGWNITITSATLTNGTADDLPPPDGKTYLVVDVVMKNVSSANQDANLFDWNLRDSTGQAAQLGTLSSAADITGTIESGAQTHGQLVFEVATSDHTFTLEYAPLFTLAAIWDISV